MAKVMISMPDRLLAALDAEAERRRTTRSGLLQDAARRELGLLLRDREEILAALDSLAQHWQGPVDVVAMLKADRNRVL